MWYKKGDWSRLRSCVKVGSVYALAAALIFGVAGSSFAGKRHHGHARHNHHHGYAAASLLGLGALSLWLSFRRIDYRWPERRTWARAHRQPPTVPVVPQIRYVVLPTPAPAMAPVRRRAALPPDCLMIREYQTRIIISGKEVEAYGDACMQPDGSWRRGPPKLIPQ